MSQWIDGNYKTFTSGEAIQPFRLLHFASGVVTMAELTESIIGVSDRYTANASPCNVKLITGTGTVKLEAEAAIAEGAIVYCRANGCIDDSSANSAFKVGISLEAATNAGDIIEVLIGTPFAA